MRWILDRQFPIYWFKAMLDTESWFPCRLQFTISCSHNLIPPGTKCLHNLPMPACTPQSFALLYSDGIALIMAVISAIKLLIAGWKTKFSDMHQSPVILFLLVWFFVGWALTYIPTDFSDSYDQLVANYQSYCLECLVFSWVLPSFKKSSVLSRS